MSMMWDCILWYYLCGKLKHFRLSTVGVHYGFERKDKKCLGKLYFKGKLEADSFLVELIFTSLSDISQGDS